MTSTRALNLVFALLTVADVASWHVMVRSVLATGVSRVVYEQDPGQPITPRAVDWRYSMLPQPSFLDERTLVIPPGYPVLVNPAVTTFRWHEYEDRGVPFLAFTSVTGTQVLGRDGALEPLGTEAPPVARLQDVLGCFPGAQDVVFRVDNGVVEGGTCRWAVPAGAGVVLHAPQASARLEAGAGQVLGERSLRWWLLLLVLLGSLLGRAGLKNTTWVTSDAAGVVLVLLLSFVTPLWVVLWAVKNGLGAALGAGQLLRRTWTLPWGRAGLLLALAGVLLAAWWLDPVRVAAVNTAFNERGAGQGGEASVSPPAGTTHLVLGYSMVNGAALVRGAYGERALDAELARACGGAGVTWARHAVDGANACFMAEHWNALSSTLPALQQRVLVGGFNDDLTAPMTRARLWVLTLLGLLPLADPSPRWMSTWELGARANLEPARSAELMACVETLARGSRAPLVHVYDLPSFDIGRERRFGREAWVELRRRALAAGGGTLVDMRSLLPGESPVYFNDFVHPSEVGYRVLAAQLCARLGGPR